MYDNEAFQASQGYMGFYDLLLHTPRGQGTTLQRGSSFAGLAPHQQSRPPSSTITPLPYREPADDDDDEDDEELDFEDAADEDDDQDVGRVHTMRLRTPSKRRRPPCGTH